MPAEANLVPFVIGITGISGSGKTWLVNKLIKEYDVHATVIRFDDYYRPLAEQEKDENGHTNFDLPSALYQSKFHEDLLKLIEQHPVLVKEYHFELENKEETVRIVSPAPIIVVEGLFILHDLAIAGLLSAKIFIEAENNLTLERRLKRDKEERGIPEARSLYQWHNHVIPAYNKYIEPYKENCDLIIQNSDTEAMQLDIIKQLIYTKAHPSVIARLGN